MYDAVLDSLVNGGDNFGHYHSTDRDPTHDTLARLQQLVRRRTVSGTYSADTTDDILLASAGPITLPIARNGKEYEVIMTGTTPITVNLTSPDLIYGESSVLIEQKGTALRFKAISGGWVFI